MKAIAFLINVVYWLGLFIFPAAILCFVALWLYSNNTIGLFASIALGVVGIILGIIAAEYVRRRYGLNNFWSGISTNMDNVPPKEKDGYK